MAGPTTTVLAEVVAGTVTSMFVASGVPKIRRPFDSALAMVRFGAVKRIRPVAGRALGIVETGIGVAVLVAPSPFVPALIGIALLTLFSALIARALARGQSFECACFGTGERISWATVVRNGVFIALCVVVAVEAGTGGFAPVAVEGRLLGLLTGALVMSAYLVLSTLAWLKPFSTTLDPTGEADG